MYRQLLCVTIFVSSLLVARADGPAPQQLFDFSKPGEVVSAVRESEDAKAEALPDTSVVRLTYQPGGPWPGVYFNGPKQGWDLTAYRTVRVKVRNVGEYACEFGVRVDSPKPPEDKTKPFRLSVGGKASLEPGQEQVVLVPLNRHQPGAPQLFGMDRYPQGLDSDETRINPAEVVGMALFVMGPTHVITVEVSSIEAADAYEPAPWESMDEATFFPFIDPFGQFKHQEWPGKLHSEADLKASWTAEQAALEAHPGPAGWDTYGGWAGGPQLEATGRFRTAKVDGKWWLVDPDGRLFFSLGISGIGTAGGAPTPIDGRRNYFEWLPDEKGEWAGCYERQNRVSNGDYRGKQPLGFSFRRANMIRKYGDAWETVKVDLVHRRFRSWGLNTLGCWTRQEIWEKHRTPYCTWYFYQPMPIRGRQRGWKKFPDVFAPNYQAQVEAAVERFVEVSAGDPWCIGVFSDNELPWTDSATLSACVLSAPPEQPAKMVFIGDLKAKYATIEDLNAVWHTTMESWDALAANRDLIKLDDAAEDCAAFYNKLAHTYFRIARDAVKAADPNLLYLGCRLNGNFPEAARVAAEYCDVISYNFYRDSVASMAPPEGVDKPVIIGEFHFGALDRGLFGSGLRPVADQQARAAAFQNYVLGAAANPYIVGCHWFTYGDEPATGRSLDGENHQIGFVDVTDTPYPELVEAARQTSARMYQVRSGKE